MDLHRPIRHATVPTFDPTVVMATPSKAAALSLPLTFPLNTWRWDPFQWQGEGSVELNPFVNSPGGLVPPRPVLFG